VAVLHLVHRDLGRAFYDDDDDDDDDDGDDDDGEVESGGCGCVGGAACGVRLFVSVRPVAAVSFGV
jgi:hypothetical protein